jgi:hypothetical protein
LPPPAEYFFVNLRLKISLNFKTIKPLIVIKIKLKYWWSLNNRKALPIKSEGLIAN